MKTKQDKKDFDRKCLSCGRKLTPVYDKVAKQVTGHLWKCKCMDKALIISIG